MYKLYISVHELCLPQKQNVQSSSKAIEIHQMMVGGSQADIWRGKSGCHEFLEPNLFPGYLQEQVEKRSMKV